MIIYGFDPNPYCSTRGPGRPEINDFILDECNTILWGNPLCYYLSQSLGNSSSIRMIMFIVSCSKKLSLVRDVVQQDLVFNQ